MKCGRPLEPEARFCEVCGTEVSGEQVRTVLTSTAVPDNSHDQATVLTETAAPDGQERSDPLLERVRRATIGEYELLIELGRGGMAAVYLAHDLALDRKVAIKVMFPETIGSEGAAERFRREARTSASLNHPNIIPIYTVSEKSDLLYFVMQFIAGRPLDDVIREAAPLPVRLVQTIMHHVGGALAYAHRRGVVHRDIKPSNIMLDEDGWAIVTDFGIAKVSAAESITRTGSTIGTPSYMSPEQCSAREVGGASDQYALGIVAYEMLTGKPPFDGDSAMQIMFQHVSEPLPALLERREDCPRELADAVERMLQKQPEDRWPSLEAALGAIGAVPSDETEEVRTAIVDLAKTNMTREALAKVRTPQSPLPATLERQRAQATGAGGGSRIPRTNVPQRPRVQASNRKSKRALLFGGLAAVVTIVLAVVFFPLGEPAAGGAQTTLPSADGAPPTDAPAVTTVQIDGSSEPLEVGGSIQLQATALDAAGNQVSDVTIEWESSDSGVALVSSAGIVTALAAGNAQITARHESHSAAMALLVRRPAPVERGPTGPAPVATVAIEPNSLSLTPGESGRLSIDVRDQAGNRLTGRSVNWLSTDDRVATVGVDGTVRAVSPGTALVTALTEGRSGRTTVTVSPIPVAGVQVSPSSASLTVGETARLSASTLDAQNRRLNGRTVDWRSSAPDIAQVSSNGTVSALSAGTATITASSESIRGSARVTVQAASEVPVEPPPPDPATLRRGVEEAIQRYARAIESQDMAAVRRVAPGLNATQEQSWQRFFDAANRLTITFTTDVVDFQGSTAIADVSGVLRYDGEQTDTQFRATLEQRGGTWVITGVQ